MKHFIVVKYLFILLVFAIGLLPLDVLASKDDELKCLVQLQPSGEGVIKYHNLHGILRYEGVDDFCKIISERDIRIGDLEDEFSKYIKDMARFYLWATTSINDLLYIRSVKVDQNISTLATRLDIHAKLISELDRHGEIPAVFRSYGEWITSNELSRTDKEKELKDMIKKLTERIESLEKKIGGKKRVDRLDKME